MEVLFMEKGRCQLQKFQQLAQAARFPLAILLAICPYLLAILGKNLFFAKHPR
jgi:hypothetical protein